MKNLVIIDGKSILYRGYYAMGNLSTKDGTPTGGIYGFVSILLEAIDKLKPEYVAVAWDKPKTNIRRRVELYPEYKAGRSPAPADFYAQIPLLIMILDAFHIPLYEADDYEADDIMGALSQDANRQGVHTDLISGDLDMLQLIDHDTKFYALKTGFSRVDEFDLQSFEEKYGLRQDQFLDLKALKGDSSDNIPGVPGVGEKTAIKLLQEYGTLDGVYENLGEIKGALHDKLASGKDSAYLSKELGRIWFDAPVKFNAEDCDLHLADPAKVLSILQQLEFRSLFAKAEKIFGKAKKPEEGADESPAPKGSEVATKRASGPVKTGATQRPKEMADSSASQPDILEFDVKASMHHDKELAKGILDGKSYWDLNQAAFLLNQPIYETENKQNIYTKQLAAFSELPKLHRLYLDFDLPLIPILYRMETAGISIDKPYFEQLSTTLTEQQKHLEGQIFELAGQNFNLNSPAQLSTILFDKLSLPTTGIKKRIKAYSTDAKTLETLRGQHPIIALIDKYREVSKLKSTYVDALPPLADADNHIHTTFTQDVTATGRLSSKDPNLQNIPVRTEMGREIRTGFVSGPDKVFVSADYSQFELRLAAVLAGDQPLIDDFNAGLDIHTKTASDAFSIPMSQVTKDQRRAAKVINFGVLYGMSPKGLSDAAGMSFYEAKKFIDKYFELREPIRKYLDQTLAQATTEGYVETFYGRRRYTPDVHAPNFVIRQAAIRAAQNMPIQGTEADLMKRAMIHLDAALAQKVPSAQIILQIHDSLIVTCAPSDLETVKSLMREIMESVAPELPIKLAVDITSGTNWGEL